MTRVEQQNGFVLLPVVLAIALIAVIAFMLNNQGAINVDETGGMLEAAQAEQVARAGLAHATWGAQNSGCAGDMAMTTVAFGPGGAHNYSATVTAGSTGTLYTLSADQDTYIKASSPTGNFGNEVEVFISKDIDGEKALYRFDLASLPAGSRIQSATAWLYLTDNDKDEPIAVHRINTDWTENGATWNNMTSGYNTTVLHTILPQLVKPAWVKVNLTAAVQAWVNGSVPNYGIILFSNSDKGSARFSSREWAIASQRPYLEVTTAGSPVSPTSITASGTLDSGVSRSVTRTGVKATQSADAAFMVQPDASGQDTYIDDGQPGVNLGGTTPLRISNKTNSQKRGLLRFDLGSIPVDATVNSAELEMDLLGIGSGGTASLNVHRVTSAWVEGEANWNEARTGVAWSSAGGDYDTAVEATATIDALLPGSTILDITGLAADWVNGASPNHGLMLLGSAGVNHADFSSSDDATAEDRPKLTITYACECGSPCLGPQGSGTVLMVVVNPTTLVPVDAYKKSLFESWGYTVTIIGESENVAAYDSALASSDVVYISETVNSAQVGTRLVGATIGVVSEDGAYNDALGISNNAGIITGSAINVTDTSHYITRLFPAGPLEIYDAEMEQLVIFNGPAPDLQTLASIGGYSSLVTLEKGATLKGGGTAAGHRVMLPLGQVPNFNWNYLNNNGRLIVQRALQWGTGNLGAATVGFYRDEFNSLTCDSALDYSGSDGSLDWSAQAWTEIGETTNTCSGGIKVFNDLGDNRVRIVEPDKGLMREVDLSAFAPATLHFDYRRENFDSSTDMLSVSVSDDEGMNWTEVAQLVGPADDAAYLTADIDITPYAGKHTVIRFMTLNIHIAGSEKAYIDNVQIDDSGVTAPSVQTILLVVQDAASPAAQDIARKTLMEGWGYSVNMISASDSQANFDAAAATADVAYVVEQQQSTVLGTKLRAATLGVVVEEAELRQDIGFSANRDWPSTRDTVDIVNNTHYITSPFATGLLSIATAPIEVVSLSGQLAGGLQVLGEHDWGGAQASLAIIDTGGDLYGGGTASGRRVQLPWGRTGFDVNALNTDGLTLMQRAIEWAMGGGGGGGGGGSCDGTFRDEFSTTSYAGSDGTLAWATDWLEINESDGPATGDEQIKSSTLLVSNNDGGGEGVQREANLDGATAAMLTFDFKRKKLDDSGDYVTIDISTDGDTGPWIELGRFEGPGTDADFIPVSYDIGAYISVNTRIRFLTSPGLEDRDELYFDNIEIQCSP